MSLTRQSRFIVTTGLIVAGCFCLLSFAPLPRPLDSHSSPAIGAPHQNLSCHAPEEVSPGGTKLPAPYAVGLTPVSIESPHALEPRAMARVLPGAIESWLIRQRTTPPSPDNSGAA